MKQKQNNEWYMWSLIKYKPLLYMITIVLNILIGFIPLIE